MWNDRNDFVFRQLIPNPIRSFKNFSSIAKNFLLVTSIGRMDHQSRRNNIIRWHPPDVDFHKINFDGSIIGTSAATGFVIRAHHRHPLMAEARKLGQNTITIAEALAMRDALHLAKARNLKKIKIERDSKIVIQPILGKYNIPWRIKVIIEDIKWLASSFKSISWNHIYRETNFFADAITSFGHG